MGLENHRTISATEKILNTNYDSDIKHTIQYTRWLLEFLGIWPMVVRNPKKIEIYRSRIVIVICAILIVFLVVPCSLHMIFREKDRFVRIMLLGPMGFFFTNTVKYCLIIFRIDAIKLCIEHVEIDWMRIDSDNDREIMSRNINVGRALTVLCGVFVYTGGMSYHTIMPLWNGNTINEQNETVRPIVYPGYDMFVDPQSSPNYEIIFYTNCVSAFIIFTITTGACNLAAIFVSHACGQIQIIISRLETLFDSSNSDNSQVLNNRVGIIVKYHVRVLRFIAIIENVLCEICFVEVVASTLIICLAAYCCMTEWDNSETIAIITYFEFMIALCFNIYIFCHIGELLKEQSYQVGKATYMIDWYRLPRKSGLPLIMIIAMANCPRKIKAGRMMELSVESFGAIIKMSVAYLNMLRTMAN